MRFKVFQRAFIAVMLLLVFSSTKLLAEEKKYPPYPDVWGYELPWLKENKNDKHFFLSVNTMSDVKKMLNGDYLFIYSIRKTKKDEKFPEERGEVLIEGVFFFSGERRDAKDIIKAEGDKHFLRPEFYKKEFSDGSKIKVTRPYPFKCRPTINNFIEKRDKDNIVIFEKALIYLPDNPIRVHSSPKPGCDNVPQGSGSYLRWVDQIDLVFIPLEDETFLIADENSKAVIRFDKDLNTKSDLLNNRIFIVDKKVIDGFNAKAVNDQDRTEAIYKHIINLKKGGLKNGDSK